MSKYVGDAVSNFRFAALVVAFVIGAAVDWFVNKPTEAHWLVVGAAFILLVALEYLDTIQTRLKQVEWKLNTILEKLDEP